MDDDKNKKVFLMKLDRRILENIVNGKYDTYEFEKDSKWVKLWDKKRKKNENNFL